MNKITITGSYKGNDVKGIIVGGKLFLPNHVTSADVDEQVFLNLLLASKNNGWFKIHEHNYNEFLLTNGRGDEVKDEPKKEVKKDESKKDEPKKEVKKDESKTEDMKTEKPKNNKKSKKNEEADIKPEDKDIK